MNRLLRLAAKVDERLKQFADERNRDPEGRFDSGTVARPDDFAIAMMPAPKPKMGLGKKLAIAGTAGLLGGTATGRKLVKGAAGAFKDRESIKAAFQASPADAPVRILLATDAPATENSKL